MRASSHILEVRFCVYALNRKIQFCKMTVDILTRCWIHFEIPLFNTFIMLLLPVTTHSLTLILNIVKITTHVLTCVFIYTYSSSEFDKQFKNFIQNIRKIYRTQFNIGLKGHHVSVVVGFEPEMEIFSFH